MAVLLESHTLVLRKDAVACHFPGGVQALREITPNATWCADAHLVRVAFMVAQDREGFVRRLRERVPLTGEILARLDEGAEPADHPWLTVGRCAGRPAVWLKGAAPEPLVVPLMWQPGRVFWQDESLLDFVREEGGVEVFRHRETGQLHYRGRVRSPEPAVDLQRLDGLFREATAGLADKVTGPGPARVGFFERRRIRKAIRQLEAVVAELPDHWNSWWFMGLAHRYLRAHAPALEALAQAYRHNPGHPDVAREYGGQLLRLGQTAEGVRVSRRVFEAHPTDVGLQGNYALALLLDGQLDKAVATAQGALVSDPSDAINAALVRLALAVRAGERAQPRTLLELEEG